jgi:hypothetical protein
MNLRYAVIRSSASDQIVVDDGPIAALKNERSSTMMLSVDEMLRFVHDNRSACYLTITQAFFSVSSRMYQRSMMPTFADCSHPKHYPRAV